MAGPLSRRLGAHGPLGGGDLAALARFAVRESAVVTHADLVRRGEPTETALLVLEGTHLERGDHGIATRSPCRIARVPRVALEEPIATRPAVAPALRRTKPEAEARSRGWLAALGIGRATGRLLREVIDPLHAVGLDSRNEGPLPLTQVDMTECIGTRTVHVNRALQELRRSGAVELKGSRLRLADRARLDAPA